MSRHTVYVTPTGGGFRWFCGCGRRHWFKVESAARADGLDHQLERSTFTERRTKSRAERDVER